LRRCVEAVLDGAVVVFVAVVLGTVMRMSGFSVFKLIKYLRAELLVVLGTASSDSVLPQVMPVLLGNSLYFLESNLRSATILGVVGAGGIGFFLMDRLMISAWREVSLIVIMVLVTVACIDALSRVLRGRLIGPVGR
jgi:hypothetical protein